MLGAGNTGVILTAIVGLLGILVGSLTAGLLQLFRDRAQRRRITATEALEHYAEITKRLDNHLRDPIMRQYRATHDFVATTRKYGWDMFDLPSEAYVDDVSITLREMRSQILVYFPVCEYERRQCEIACDEFWADVPIAPMLPIGEPHINSKVIRRTQELYSRMQNFIDTIDGVVSRKYGRALGVPRRTTPRAPN